MTDRAVLAGGCFWGMQDLVRKLHDPTTPHRQGNDRGASYRSAIWKLPTRPAARRAPALAAS